MPRLQVTAAPVSHPPPHENGSAGPGHTHNTLPWTASRLGWLMTQPENARADQVCGCKLRNITSQSLASVLTGPLQVQHGRRVLFLKPWCAFFKYF